MGKKKGKEISTVERASLEAIFEMNGFHIDMDKFLSNFDEVRVAACNARIGIAERKFETPCNISKEFADSRICTYIIGSKKPTDIIKFYSADVKMGGYQRWFIPKCDTTSIAKDTQKEPVEFKFEGLDIEEDDIEKHDLQYYINGATIILEDAVKRGELDQWDNSSELADMYSKIVDAVAKCVIAYGKGKIDDYTRQKLDSHAVSCLVKFNFLSTKPKSEDFNYVMRVLGMPYRMKRKGYTWKFFREMEE